MSDLCTHGWNPGAPHSPVIVTLDGQEVTLCLNCHRLVGESFREHHIWSVFERETGESLYPGTSGSPVCELSNVFHAIPKKAPSDGPSLLIDK